MAFLSALIYGILAGCFATLAELLLLFGIDVPAAGLPAFSFWFIVFSGILEEIARFTFAQRWLSRFPKIILLSPGRFTGLAIIFGVGFASLECILNIFESAPAFFFVGPFLVHIGNAALIALTFRHTRNRIGLTSCLSLVLAVLLHICYNAFFSVLR